jgi:hypothetical protein
MATLEQKAKLNYTNAALALYEIGWTPYPLFPNSTVVSVDLEVWLEELSPSVISQYWRLHPNHGLTAEGMTHPDFCWEYEDDAVLHE